MEPMELLKRNRGRVKYLTDQRILHIYIIVGNSIRNTRLVCYTSTVRVQISGSFGERTDERKLRFESRTGALGA